MQSAAGHEPYNIDERWFQEWFEEGIAALVHYLTMYAAFDRWCGSHNRED